MKMTKIAAIGILMMTQSTFGQSTAFTYQGRLDVGGTPANGLYDFKFWLFDAPELGIQIGVPAGANGVPVTNGLFTVPIDFGAAAFSGESRYLQVSVSTNGGSDYELLSPRQELTATPYALHAKSAATVNWIDILGVPPDFADGTDNNGFYLPGVGLSLDSANQFHVSFGGSGSAVSAARSDHDHFGQVWDGSRPWGLQLRNAREDGAALYGVATATVGAGIGVEGVSMAEGGAGVAGFALGSSSLKSGVSGATVGGGYGVQGFQDSNVSDEGAGVFGFSSSAHPDAAGVLGILSFFGSGAGVRGVARAANGVGVFGEHEATRGVAPAIHGVSRSPEIGAVAILGEITSGDFAEGAAAVRGRNHGTGADGIGVWGSHGGRGEGVLGTSATGTGVLGTCEGTVGGTGVRGFAGGVGGWGVVGRAIGDNGTGVYAEGPGPNGTALTLARGAIRVDGAAVNTSTPVFIHRATAANTSGAVTVLDNPYTNGKPDAILLVTHNYQYDIAVDRRETRPIGVYYTTTMQWAILHEDDSPMPEGRAFNVMVVNP